MSADPFETAALRAAVLDAWSRTPTRLREDANTEEDHATGYYRDRVVVELSPYDLTRGRIVYRYR